MWSHPGSVVAVSPSPVKATHCPHPMEGTRVGCRALVLEVMEQGGYLSPLPLGQAVGVGVHCPPCSVGRGVGRTLADVGVHTCGTSTHCQGWWSPQHPVLALPSHESTFLQAQGALGRLWLPVSSRPWWSHPHPHPSSLSGGAGSPAVPGSGAARTAGRSHRPETGGSIAPISAHKQQQQLPSSALQSAGLEIELCGHRTRVEQPGVGTRGGERALPARR